MTTEEFHRKLTAILSADVVGYSRLMGDDEAATVKTLETYKGVMFSLIRQHRGRVVDSPGDNLLAEFGSVVDAVQCAVSIQKELQTRNADLSENRRMEFRIGINLGDVIEEEDRIYGDGVNIAARLEALADPGGICISKTAFDHIESKLPLGYEFLGEQTVKNIVKPVGAYKVLMETRVVDAKTKREAKAVWFWRRKPALFLGIIVILAIVAVLYWNFYHRGPSIEPEQVPGVSEVKESPKNIAVLPFDDLSPEKDQEYFVLGLSEEILNSLSNISGLHVTSKTSAFAFKGTNKTIQEIAEILGRDYVLEGSVRKAGNELRITAQLIQVADDRHLWSKTYDRELKDIFAVQEDIATAVAGELKTTLGVNKSFKQLGGTDNAAAYELYLTAKGQRSDLKIDRALGSIDAAILLDPKFALAYALKSNIHNSLITDVPDSSIAAEIDQGLAAAQKAIELEPNLAEAHFALGMTKTVKGSWIEAESAYQKSLELQSDPSSRYELAFPVHYMCVGYFEKAKEILEAQIKNDPLNRVFHLQYIDVLFCHLGDREGAEEENKLSKELFKDEWQGDLIMFSLRLSRGETVAKNELPNMVAAEFNAMGIDLESPEKSLAVYRKLYTDMGDKLPIIGLVSISLFAAYFGDPEFAMDLIEKAGIQRIDAVTNLWCPVMKEVRQLPRFKKFVRETGLVDYWNEFGWPDICHPLENGDFECD